MMSKPEQLTLTNHEQGVHYKKMSEQSKKLKLPLRFIEYDIMSILSFRRFEAEGKSK
jgi:hypothetical protein